MSIGGGLVRMTNLFGATKDTRGANDEPASSRTRNSNCNTTVLPAQDFLKRDASKATRIHGSNARFTPLMRMVCWPLARTSMRAVPTPCDREVRAKGENCGTASSSTHSMCGSVSGRATAVAAVTMEPANMQSREFRVTMVHLGVLLNAVIVLLHFSQSRSALKF